MNRIEVELALSPSDRQAIVREVLAGVEQLLVNQPLLVDGEELAVKLGISRATVDRLVQAGVIPSVTIGRRRLYQPDDCVLALTESSKKKRGEAQ